MTLLLFSFFLFISPAQAQQKTGTALLDSLLGAEKYAVADSALQSHIETLRAAGDMDSLGYYPYYVGVVEQHKRDTKQGIASAEQFIDELKTHKEIKPKALRQAYVDLAYFYGVNLGRPADAYKSYEQAMIYTKKMENKTGEDLGKIEFDLGIFAFRMGNIGLAMQHHRTALEYHKSYAKTTDETYYHNYNAMGIIMWHYSKMDSAQYYYDRAMEMLEKMEQTPSNRYYRPAIVNFNKADLYEITGQISEAIKSMKAAIDGFQQFVKNEEVPIWRRDAAREALYQAIENLSNYYKELGDFTKARQMLEYVYQQKQDYFDAGSREIFKTQILLGQTEYALKNNDKALEYLNTGIENFEKFPDKNFLVQAAAYHTKALLYSERGESKKAQPLFEQSEIFYEKAYGDANEDTFLDFLASSALFYAQKGNKKKALQNARRAFDYVIKNQGKGSLQAFKHQLNVAKVYYELGRYREAAERSRQSLAILSDSGFQRDNLMDSVQVQFQKPDALLLQSKAEYQLDSGRDTTFLIQTLERLDEALAIVDRRRLILASEEDVNIQIANNKALFEFAKKIALELYQKTGNKKYLDRTIGYHESAIYNRIRARINAQKAIRFADIPDSVVAREAELKQNINQRLTENDITGYLGANSAWQVFMDSLQTGYPRYFSLRYGSFSEPTEPVIPENSTVIRYFLVGDRLYALLLTDDRKALVALDYDPVRDHIRRLHENPYNASTTGGLLYDLYVRIWQPFEEKIETKRVIIIPDGELFNLSFETLATAPVASFGALAEKSLLARHAISYQYSLNLIQNEAATDFERDLAAFAPGFGDDLKSGYRTGARDSLFLDETYLTLLPQPFTMDLVKRLESNFGGNVYTGAASTEQEFTTSAGSHKIIHIGTHAESNNISPEYSRLFFAKDATDSTGDDNSLYAYEIYNHDLSSNLTLLTACSTGKPQHQPGEGMISLAHAFNYAGSRSLLTGLWNIDEKASAEIVDYFYQNLSDGLSKDAALQQAKLAYLKTANGRSAAPVYWAGLVLLGNAEAIPLERRSSSRPWLLAGLILLIVAGGYLLVSQKRDLSTQRD